MINKAKTKAKYQLDIPKHYKKTSKKYQFKTFYSQCYHYNLLNTNELILV